MRWKSLSTGNGQDVWTVEDTGELKSWEINMINDDSKQSSVTNDSEKSSGVTLTNAGMDANILSYNAELFKRLSPEMMAKMQSLFQ